MEQNEIKMPQLSDSMEEGTILTWLVEDGQPVSAGDELVELETDKAAMTHESEATGVLQIVAAEGETVAVGELIARIGESPADGEGPRSSDGTDEPDRDKGTSEAVTDAAGRPGDDPAVVDEPDFAVRSGKQSEAQAANAGSGNGASAATSRGEGVVATPLARRVASAKGVDLTEIAGSGPRGRVLKADVFRAAGISGDTSSTTPAVPRPAPADSAGAGTRPGSGADERSAKGAARQVELTRFQGVVARRMAEAKATIPHYQVQTEVDMDAAVELRAGFKAIGDGELAPSFNDMIVKSSGLALREFPQANGSFQNDHFVLFERVNIGIAVAADDTLVVPTIVDADRKSLTEIKADSKHLAEKVRSGKATPPELAGGTFTVSNLGMYGMTAIFPVINPPQSAILGVGAMREQLKRDATGEIVDSTSLTLTLSCDHRILNGADASRFLFLIKEYLEQPLRLTL